MTGAGERRRPAWVWGVAAVIAVGAALRVAGVFDDFWLDEIWSWRIARALRSAADVLTSPAARVDNNHPLNTLLMYWMGDQAYWPVYRLPSLVAGVATVLLATWHAARRYGRAEAVAAAVLIGLSYPLVVYSSEARGYGLMVFFAVAGFVAMDRFLATRSWVAAGTFSAAAVLGFLSHLTFAHFYAAVLVWSGIRLARESKSWPAAIADFARCHVLPAGFALWLYVAFARQMTIGGAPDTSLWDVVLGALSVMAGGPEGSWVVGSGAGALLVVSLVVVWRRRRGVCPSFGAPCAEPSPQPSPGVPGEGEKRRCGKPHPTGGGGGGREEDPATSLRRGAGGALGRCPEIGSDPLREDFAFYLVCVFAAPAAFVAMQAVSMRGMETLFPRYFLVSMAFGYLLAASAFGVAWRSRARPVAAALLALYAAGSLWQAGLFLRGTRGHYLNAAEYMAAHSPGGAVTVGSDNAFRTQMLLGFYSRYLPPGVTVTYAAAGTPEWFIVNSPQAGVRPAGPVRVAGVPYAFEREFTYHGLSGWSWYLFRRVGPGR